MKSYDPYSIKEKLLERIQYNQDWKVISGNSVINAILDAFSEASAEQARYSEMLFMESKWDISQDFKQISALANITGYTAKRKVSAKGTLYISNNNRIHEIGRTISAKDFTSGNLPWDVSTSKVDFTNSATVLDDLGNEYILTSVNSLQSGSYYTSNTIMEGSKKTTRIPASIARQMARKSKLNPYAYIPIKISNMEDAGESKSAPFFRVFVDDDEYRIVDSLLLSGANDRDVEVMPDLYNSDMYYLKFNTDSDRGVALNFSKTSSGFDYIDVQYVESKGSSGNIQDAFQRFTIRTVSGKLLYGITLDSISGGNDAETIAEIKANAPTHYLKTYTTATKSAYQEALKKIDFGSQVFAQNVKVYAGKDEDDNDVVYASLISPEIESAIEEGETTNAKIDSILNLSLDSLKAPSDNLKYIKPNYERLGVGITCTVPRGTVDNTEVLATSIQTAIDEMYGLKSSLDFGKDLYDSDIIKTIKELEPNILAVKTELEATERLEWINATREDPKPTFATSVKTIRIPFDYSKVLKGTRYTFKNFENGADYGLRIDFMFKGFTEIITTYHSTLILNEPVSRMNEEYVMIKDDNSIWHENGGPLSLTYEDYPFIDLEGNIYKEEIDDVNLKQYPLIEKVISDDVYNSITTDSSYEQLVEGVPGYISDIMIYYKGEDDLTGRIGSGFIELGIDSMYNVLQIYALKDAVLKSELDRYPLANLKCSTDPSDMEGFITDILTPYVEIYTSLRLYEKDLLINDQSYDPSAVIFIETSDSSSSTTNLKEVKLNRFLSVECSTV